MTVEEMLAGLTEREKDLLIVGLPMATNTDSDTVEDFLEKVYQKPVSMSPEGMNEIYVMYTRWVGEMGYA